MMTEPSAIPPAKKEAPATSPSFTCLLNGHEAFGVGESALNLALSLRSRGWRSQFIVLQQGKLTENCERLGLPFTVLNEQKPILLPRSVGDIGKKLFTEPQRERRMARKISETLGSGANEHFCFSWPSHVRIAGLAAKHAKSKCAWLMPNEIGQRWWGMNRRYYNRIIRKYSIQPLPNSRYTARTLGDQYVKDTLHLGINLARFNPNKVLGPTRESLGIASDALVFGIFARVDRTKGQELFWEALLQAELAGEKSHLLIVGEGEVGVLERMKQFAQQHNATDRLHFVGWTLKPEEYYGLIDVAVNSRIDPEPFGLSVIEAMAMRKPVLVHALGGPAETVLDGETGWHMASSTLQDFRQGIQRAVADQSRWTAMGIAARKRAEENFSLEAFADNFIALVNR